MTHLVRVLRNKNWSALSDNEEISFKSLPELMCDACGAKDGISSFWAVDFIDTKSLSRIIAAMATPTGELGAIRVGIILVSEVLQMGITIKPTPGSGVYDDGLRENFHRDLVIDDFKKAFKITREIRRNIHTFSANEVKGFFKSSIDLGYVSVKKLPDNAIKKLSRDGFLVFDLPIQLPATS